jgi:hypothetical protein
VLMIILLTLLMTIEFLNFASLSADLVKSFLNFNKLCDFVLILKPDITKDSLSVEWVTEF